MWNLLPGRWRTGYLGDGMGDIASAYRQAQATSIAADRVVKKSGDTAPVDQSSVKTTGTSLLSLEDQLKKSGSTDVATVRAIREKLEKQGYLEPADLEKLREVVTRIGAKLIESSAAAASMRPELKARIAGSPHADQALETYARLKEMAKSNPAIEKYINTLVLAVANPRAAVGLKTGIMTQDQALKAAQALIDMKPEDRKAVEALLDKAGSDTERALILKAAGCGARVRDDKSPTAATDKERNQKWLAQRLPELSAFADSIRGKDPAALIRGTTLINVQQTFNMSCAPTTVQKLKAEQDPLYAWNTTQPPDEMKDKLAAEQKEWLQTGGGIAVSRVAIETYTRARDARNPVASMQKALGIEKQDELYKGIQTQIAGLKSKHPEIAAITKTTGAISDEMAKYVDPYKPEIVEPITELQRYMAGDNNVDMAKVKQAVDFLNGPPAQMGLTMYAVDQARTYNSSPDAQKLNALENLKRFAEGDPSLTREKLEKDLETVYGKDQVRQKFFEIIETRMLSNAVMQARLRNDPETKAKIDNNRELKDLQELGFKLSKDERASLTKFSTDYNTKMGEYDKKINGMVPSDKKPNWGCTNSQLLDKYMTDPDFPAADLKNPTAAEVEAKVQEYVTYLQSQGIDIDKDPMGKIKEVRANIKNGREIRRQRVDQDRKELSQDFTKYTEAVNKEKATAAPADKTNLETLEKYLTDPTFKPTDAEMKQIEDAKKYLRDRKVEIDDRKIDRIRGWGNEAIIFNSYAKATAKAPERVEKVLGAEIKPRLPEAQLKQVAATLSREMANVPDDKLEATLAKRLVGIPKGAALAKKIAAAILAARQEAKEEANKEVQQKGPAATTDAMLDFVTRKQTLEQFTAGGESGGIGMADAKTAEILTATTGRPYQATSIDNVTFSDPKAEKYWKAGDAPPEQKDFVLKNTTIGSIKENDPNLARADQLLRKGQALPFAIQYTDATGHPGTGGHAMLMCDVAGNPPDRQFYVADPWTGKTAWVSEADFKSGSFATDPKYGFGLGGGPPNLGRVTTMMFPEN